MQSTPSPFSGDKNRRRPVMDVAAPHRIVGPGVAYRRVALPARPTLSRRKAIDSLLNSQSSSPVLSCLRRRSAKTVFLRLLRKTELYGRFARRLVFRMMPDIAPHKMLYGSIVGGIAFGMVSMAFMEHYFGPGVFARSSGDAQSAVVAEASSSPTQGNSQGPGTDTYNSSDDAFLEYFGETTREQYEASIREMVKGYPIEDMLPYIFQQDRITAAFLVGIGKKESNWGKRVPVLDGQDCFNYWGYRGIRRMMGTGGHTCFNSRKDAVDTVAKRLKTLIESNKLDTPEKMVVWKCGFTCQGQNRESVLKWISDVDMYFKQLNDDGTEE